MTGRWEPDERDDGEEDEEMARKMRVFNRIIRCFFFFVLFPAFGVGCIVLTWVVVGGGRGIPTHPLFYLMAVGGPLALWIAGVRLVLAAMMLGDDELRTVEEDERQKRLFWMYLQPGTGGILDLGGLLIGLAHLAVVLMSF